jgi:hypothetical protein
MGDFHHVLKSISSDTEGYQVSGKKISGADTNSLSAAKDNRPLFNLDNARIFKVNSHALAVLDASLIPPSHTLILPKWHILSFFDVNQEEQAAMFDLMSIMPPDSSYIGTNNREAAGQKIMHLHLLSDQSLCR